MITDARASQINGVPDVRGHEDLSSPCLFVNSMVKY